MQATRSHLPSIDRLGMVAELTQMVFIEISRLRRHELEYPGHLHEHGSPLSAIKLWAMLIPLAIGLLIPAQLLDSVAFATKGFQTIAPLVSMNSSELTIKLR